MSASHVAGSLGDSEEPQHRRSIAAVSSPVPTGDAPEEPSGEQDEQDEQTGATVDA